MLETSQLYTLYIDPSVVTTDWRRSRVLVVSSLTMDGAEHTLAAYDLAIEQGADFIEPDLVITRDGVLVARHESEISRTTDVAARKEFADRRRRQVIDGTPVEGWFTEDFTLAELKTLRARERLPKLRSTDHDGQYDIPTFEEILTLLVRANKGRDTVRRTVALGKRLIHP